MFPVHSYKITNRNLISVLQAAIPNTSIPSIWPHYKKLSVDYSINNWVYWNTSFKIPNSIATAEWRCGSGQTKWGVLGQAM